MIENNPHQGRGRISDFSFAISYFLFDPLFSSQKIEGFANREERVENNTLSKTPSYHSRKIIRSILESNLLNDLFGINYTLWSSKSVLEPMAKQVGISQFLKEDEKQYKRKAGISFFKW